MFVVNEQVLSDVNKNFIIPPKPQILDDLDKLAHQNEPPFINLCSTLIHNTL